MTNIITDTGTVAGVTLLVRELRTLRERVSKAEGRQVSFAEVADSVASINPAADLRRYLGELAEILDSNTAPAVDADLDERWRDSVAPLFQGRLTVPG